MRVRARAVAVAVAFAWPALAVLDASPAYAQQPSAAERETARNLMDEGDKKRDAGDLRGALKAYSDADGIMNVPTTAIEVARTQAALGQLVEAKDTLARLLRMPAKPNDPPPFGAARKAAETLASELGARIPSVSVTTNAEPGQTAEIAIDGEAIAPATPRKLNPGSHAIVVRVGAVVQKQDVTLSEREAKVVTVDLRDPGARSAGAGPKGASGPNGQASPDVLPKVLFYGGFSVAAIGLGVGAITGVISIEETNKLKPTCPNDTCPVGSQGDIDSANTLGNVSTVAFIVGGVGAAAGVVGLILTVGSEKHPRAAAPAAARVAPVVGPSYAGLRGTF